jgi:hypothetical protein
MAEAVQQNRLLLAALAVKDLKQILTSAKTPAAPEARAAGEVLNSSRTYPGCACRR